MLYKVKIISLGKSYIKQKPNFYGWNRTINYEVLKEDGEIVESYFSKTISMPLATFTKLEAKKLIKQSIIDYRDEEAAKITQQEAEQEEYKVEV